MTCPYCGADTKVVDSVPDIESVYRRRKCKSCGEIIYTEELDTDQAELMFKSIKNDRRMKYG